MGIKFHCPNGHKLHVKSFLAGKKGVCPECGIKIVIPEQSEPHRSRKSHQNEPTTVHAGAVSQTASAMVAATVPSAMGPVVAGPGVTGQVIATSVSPVAATTPNPIPAPVPTTAMPMPAYNPQVVSPAVAMPTASPHAASAPAIPTGFGTAAAMGLPVGGIPVGAPAVPMGMPAQAVAPIMHSPITVGIPLGHPQGIPAGAFPGPTPGPNPMGSHVAGPMALATPAFTHAPDPIDENPNATWYVRPPSGGQYGPARGDVMRKWIGEGRVSADSLVWREGWTDWLSASAVFPSLKAGAAEETSSPAAPFLASSPAAGTKSAKRKTPSKSRGPSAGTAVAIVVFLALMAVGLLIALFYVLNQTQHSSHKRTSPQHAAARCVEPWCVF